MYAYMYFSIPQPCNLYAYLSHPIGVSLEPSFPHPAPYVMHKYTRAVASSSCGTREADLEKEDEDLVVQLERRRVDDEIQRPAHCIVQPQLVQCCVCVCVCVCVRACVRVRACMSANKARRGKSGARCAHACPVRGLDVRGGQAGTGDGGVLLVVGGAEPSALLMMHAAQISRDLGVKPCVTKRATRVFAATSPSTSPQASGPCARFACTSPPSRVRERTERAGVPWCEAVGARCAR